MSADYELHQLAIDIVNGVDECESADRTKVAQTLIWNFLYGVSGRHRTGRKTEHLIETLFAAIEHGDEKHRAWLKEKIDEHFRKKT